MLIFAWIALRDRLRRPLALAFAGLFAVCLVRELDFLFDRYLLDNLWPVFAALITVVVGVYLFRHRGASRPAGSDPGRPPAWPWSSPG